MSHPKVLIPLSALFDLPYQITGLSNQEERSMNTLKLKSQIYYNILILLHIFVFLNTDWKAIFFVVFQQAIS